MTFDDIMERVRAALEQRHPGRNVRVVAERTPIHGVTVWTAEGVVRNAEALSLIAIHVGRGHSEADACETLAKSLGVDITEEVARTPFVVTRMEQPPTDANGMPVEPSR